MARALPFFEDPEALRKLGALYVGASLAAAASFYAALLDRGYSQPPALAAAAGVGLACLLLRMAQRAEGPTAQVLAPRRSAVLRRHDLLLHLGLLIHYGLPLQGQMGLMLVTVRADEDGVDGRLVETIRNFVRGCLCRDADSPVFELDALSFAVAECRPDVGVHVERLARGLQREFADRSAAADLGTVRLIVGAALAGREQDVTPADLLAGARTATRLAEAQGRDSFFRRL